MVNIGINPGEKSGENNSCIYLHISPATNIRQSLHGTTTATQQRKQIFLFLQEDYDQVPPTGGSGVRLK